MANEQRVGKYQRSEDLEKHLRYFEQLLGPIERNELLKLPVCNEPILFIVGCARSGSTLIYQYLSYSGLFTYPTNFVSRFYFAPYLGARLQQMLLDFDFRQEIFDSQTEDRFQSTMGKTKGPKAPHEFWYFWRQFFDFPAEQKLDSSALDNVDGERFLKELNAFQLVENRPLLTKGMIMNWNIPYLANLDQRIHFLFVRRDVEDNARSLVRARREFFGNEEDWYSFKPPGYRDVIDKTSESQTRWQVNETNKAVVEGLQHVPNERVWEIDYNDFCRDPSALLAKIAKRWQRDIPEHADDLPTSFSVRGHARPTNPPPE